MVWHVVEPKDSYEVYNCGGKPRIENIPTESHIEISDMKQLAFAVARTFGIEIPGMEIPGVESSKVQSPSRPCL